ncbi:MAG: hypothetical protein JW794_07715 [Candidatus Cloacimonetes bacterium]|nr:hypothetical protein [Candidatus Cloacimonadota bacterium]
MKIKTCPVCGKEFPCYANDDRICWCESFPPIDVDGQYDCLCPDCLTKKAIEQNQQESQKEFL